TEMSRRIMPLSTFSASKWPRSSGHSNPCAHLAQRPATLDGREAPPGRLVKCWSATNREPLGLVRQRSQRELVADELVAVHVVYVAFVIDVFAHTISAGAQRVRDERRDLEVAPFKCTRFRTFFSSGSRWLRSLFYD